MTRKIVIVGANSGIAEHCARIWAAQGPVQFVLVGRNKEKLDPIAADLAVRNAGVAPQVLLHDDLTPVGCANLVAKTCANQSPDMVLIAQGMLPDQLACQRDLALLDAALVVNGTSICLLAEAFAAQMQGGAVRRMVILGSVAGDRGRKSNYAYGAAKALVASFAEGLQHRLALEKSSLTVTLAKPGPTATAMTAHLPAGKLADPAEVAARIVAAAEAGNATVYAPGKWALIMMVITHLPRFIFNKVDI
jgi:decaprenylphospho-beta-D-erythro-pentofuranosid-2-ulose 2-reductase